MMIRETLIVATAFAQHGHSPRRKERMNTPLRSNRREFLMVAGAAAIVTQGSAIALLAPAMSLGRAAELGQGVRLTRIRARGYDDRAGPVSDCHRE
jgi:hypothetical protein